MRILLHNPNGIGFISIARCKETLKMEKLKKVVLNHDVDLTALTEINKDWRTVQYEDTIWGATTTWRKHRRIQASYNVTERACKRYQVGGTAMILLGDLTFRLSHQSSDFRKLGGGR